MVEHLSLRQIELYRERKLKPGEFIEAARHLAACDACHQRLDEIAPLPNQLIPLSFDPEAGERAESLHLNYFEHLAPYVDGTIDDVDREIVESHVELCAQCALEVRELLSVKEELARAAVPSEVAAAQPTDGARTARLSAAATIWRQRFFNLRRGGAFAWPTAQAQVIAGVFVFALLIIAATLLWRAPREQPASAPAAVANVADRAEVNVSRNSSSNNASPAVTPPPNGDTTQANTGATTPQTANRSRSIKTVPSPRPDDMPQVAVSLDDGGRSLTLDRRGRFSGFEELPPSYRQIAAKALREQRIEMSPELALLRDPGGRLRAGGGGSKSFTSLSPAGTVTRTSQPTLRWQTLAGAIGYEVRIYDAKLNAVAVSPTLTGTQWSPPVPLNRGAVYSWQVAAITETGDGVRVRIVAPAPLESRALFRVLSLAELEELRRAERVAGDSHLLRGIVYAQFGMVDEAESELRELLAANPRSATARRLLHSLRATGATRDARGARQ